MAIKEISPQYHCWLTPTINILSGTESNNAVISAICRGVIIVRESGMHKFLYAKIGRVFPPIG